MQSLHGLFNRNVLVKPVDLQEVNVCGVESFQTRFNRLENGLSGQTTMVDIVLGLGHIWLVHVGLWVGISTSFSNLPLTLA